MNNPIKKKAMDAISCPETAAQLSAFQKIQPAVAAKSGGMAMAKSQSMSAVSSPEILVQLASVKMTGGIALYAAKIREEDRQAGTAPHQTKKRAFGREYGR